MKHVHNVIGARLQQVTRSGQTNEYAQLFRPGSLWIGTHYSPTNRRWCINLLPMVTVWICLKGGVRP